MGATFAAFLGPFSGVLMAAAVSGPDAKLYINAVTTLVFFIISLALVLRPSMRILSRLWLLAGFVWVLAGWVTYFRYPQYDYYQHHHHIFHEFKDQRLEERNSHTKKMLYRT